VGQGNGDCPKRANNASLRVDCPRTNFMTNKKTIKAILFDLGNVIVRFDTKTFEKGYSDYCIMREGSFIHYVTNSTNVNRYMEGRLNSSQFYSKTRRIFRMNISFTDFYRIWNSIFFPYPEMEHLIVAIKEKYPDVKLVLISDTNEAHYEFLREQYKVLDLLDDHVVSHEVGKQKPSLEMFREALRLAGTISKDTFYVDDRTDLIAAARVMGIHAFQFIGHLQLKEHLAKFGVEV